MRSVLSTPSETKYVIYTFKLDDEQLDPYVAPLSSPSGGTGHQFLCQRSQMFERRHEKSSAS